MMKLPRRHRSNCVAAAVLAAVLCLGPNPGGPDAWAANLNGSTTGLGVVNKVQQSGVSAPAATITSTASGGGSAYIIAPNANRSIIYWQTFSLSSPDSLNFAFAARNDIAVNHIASGSAAVNGVLTATVGGAFGGNVWFIAPNGVVFGANAVVDVGGLLATSSPLLLSDAAFLADTTNFIFGSAETASSVSVASGASLHAHGGLLALVAPQVSSQAGAAIGGDAGRTQALYAAAEAYEIQLSPSASSDLNLVALVIDTPSASGAPLTLGAATNAGNVYVAGAASTVNALISAPGDLAATQANAVGGDIVLSSGGLTASGGQVQASPPAAAAATSVITTTLGNVSGDAAVSLTAAGPLTVGQVSAGGGVTIASRGGLDITGTLTSTGGAAALTTTSGDITLDGSINASGQALRLTSAGAITQNSGSLTAATLMGSSVDATSLIDTTNAVGALGAFTAGSGFSFTNSQALDVSGTLTSTGGEGSIATSTGDITLDGSINASGQTLSLISAGAIAQNSGSLTASILIGSSVRATRLTGTTNAIAVLGAFNAGSGFSLTNSHALDMTGTLTGAGGADSLTTTSGAITLDGSINATGQTLSLVSAGAITQNGGSVTAAMLTGSSVGATSLTDTTNAVAELGAFNAGSGFTLTNSQALDVTGTLASTGGATSLTIATGDITLDGAIDAAGQTLSLTSAGAIIQNSGSLTATMLTGSSADAASLTGANNAVAAVGAFNAGSGFNLTNSQALDVTGPLTIIGGAATMTTTSGDMTLHGSINASGQTLNLASAGAITQDSGSLTASTLMGSSADATSLTDNTNAIAALGPFNARNGFSLTNSQALDVTGTLTSTGGAATMTTTSGDIVLNGSINATSQTLSLASAGAIVQNSGSVTAATLTGSSLDGTRLAGSANSVSVLGVFSAGSGFALTDARAIDVDGPLSSTGGDAALTTSSGDIRLNGVVNAAGQTLALNSAGTLNQASGTISAATLVGSSAGIASLNRAGNAISGLGAFSAGTGFALTDSQALIVAGPLTSTGGPATITTTSGDLTLAGAVNAAGQTLTIASAGAVNQTGGALMGQEIGLTASSGATLAGQIQAADAVTVSARGGSIVQTGSTASGGMTSYTASVGITLDGGSIVSSRDIVLDASSGGLQIIAPVGASPAFSNLAAAGVTSLTAANGSIVVGETPFVSAVDSFLADRAGSELNVSRDIPAVGQRPTLGRVFVQTGTLQIAASGGIVQQNTTPFPGKADGIVITNPSHAADPVQIDGIGAKAPTVVDLFLTVVNSGGATLSGKVVATSGDIDLMVAPTNNYRVNGCVIGQTGVCTVLSDAIVDIQPADLTGDLLLESLPDASISDPTITGTGNEEIWRKRP
jgi:filamentous hemagglutinin family protein